MRPLALLATGLLLLPLAASAGEVVLQEVRLPDPTPCLEPWEWEIERAEAVESLARLREESLLPPADATLAVLFESPLRPVPGFADFGYYVISGYPDQDPRTPDHILDYQCGDRTYDGHNGTDYVLWPFPWFKMDHEQVEVIAAAAGTVFQWVDGLDDRSCTPGGSTNKVAVRHDDGTMAWYLHLKKWSLTPKGIGERVETGEYLGLVASSGNSGIPHLHIDFRDSDWASFDPWGGPCNLGGPDSSWADQCPYYDSQILALMTHFAPPEFPDCPGQEILNTSDEFDPGDLVRFGIYHRDLLGGQLVEYEVLRPDESIADSGSYSGSEPHYTAAFALPDYQLPPGAQPGTWKIAVDYEGQRLERPFTVTEGGPAAAGAVPDGRMVPGTQLGVEKAPADQVALAWGPSCIAGDDDYEVYAGSLGDFTGHEPVACSTGGATNLTFAPAAGGRYFLVVPANGAAEGSYGPDSEGAERPPSASACLGQLTAPCP
jgi:murein DD-endopeptidase MepM/ murein hydrolase activator NlpD